MGERQLEKVIQIGARKLIDVNYKNKFISSEEFFSDHDIALDTDIIIFGASPFQLSKYNGYATNPYDLACFEKKISKLNFKKVIYLSSASVYGLTNNETSFIETDELLGVSSYAHEKIYFESIIRTYCEQINADVLILRIAGLFNLEKKGQSSKNLLDKIFHQVNNETAGYLDIFHCGNQIRNFCEITFLKKVIDILIDEPHQSSIYNVANTSPVRLKEMINKLNLSIEKPLKINYETSLETNIHNSLDSSLLFNEYNGLSELYLNEDILIKKLTNSYL